MRKAGKQEGVHSVPAFLISSFIQPPTTREHSQRGHKIITLLSHHVMILSS